MISRVTGKEEDPEPLAAGGRRRASPTKDGEVEPLTEAMLTASRVLVAVSARSLHEVEDRVTLPQFRALVVLASRGPMRLTGLSEYLAVNPSTAMRMAERLHAAGMIGRGANPDNRRESILSLTEAGSEVVEQVTARRREEIAAIVARMPRAHQAGLVEALKAFNAASGEPPAGHDPIPLGWE
jgi:DNA-binding MarR family transcriptional regulator